MASLSIVSPVYNTGAMLPELLQRGDQALAPMAGDYEWVLVDDGSTDSSWEILESLAASRPGLRAIKLSRNFGQHAAITAGLQKATGTWVVVMDSDLQDRPEDIPRLLEKAGEGFEVVQARRTGRRDGWLRRAASRIFYMVFSWLTGKEFDHLTGNFGVYRQTVIGQILAMPEAHRLFPVMVNWVGYRQASLDCPRETRGEGNSGYDFGKLLRLGINSALTYSDKPLRFVVRLGFYITLGSFLYALITLFRYLNGYILVLGYTSLIISVWFLGGILLSTLGMVGLYVGRIFEEVKRRPLFIIEKQIH
jgi:polyisoprenyl-phosphate glycosyltransferase